MSVFYVFLGTSVGVFLSYLFFVYKRKQVIRNDAEILMTNIKKVSKLVTVEGEFSEIYQHKEKNDYFFNIFSSEKKSISYCESKSFNGI
jgi:hypothetical protein